MSIYVFKELITDYKFVYFYDRSNYNFKWREFGAMAH